MAFSAIARPRGALLLRAPVVAKNNSADPSPAEKHGGLRMTDDFNLRIRD
jgi:hypothetical protein